MRGGSASRVSAEICFSLLKFVETYLRSCLALRKEVVEETTQKEALQVAYTSVQRNYEDMKKAAVATC